MTPEEAKARIWNVVSSVAIVLGFVTGIGGVILLFEYYV